MNLDNLYKKVSEIILTETPVVTKRYIDIMDRQEYFSAELVYSKGSYDIVVELASMLERDHQVNRYNIKVVSQKLPLEIALGGRDDFHSNQDAFMVGVHHDKFGDEVYTAIETFRNKRNLHFNKDGLANLMLVTVLDNY